MFAILAVLIFLKKIHAKYKYATKLPSTIFTDSQNAIRAAFQQIFVTISNVFENDCDVLSELRWQIQLSRFLITLQHVKAHQGDDVDLSSLPLDQRLNRIMDTLAKASFTQFHASYFEGVTPFMAAQKISFLSPYGRLVYDIKYKINDYKLGHETESLLAENWKIAPTHLKYISWNTLKSVARSLKRKNQYRTVKAVHSQWHTVSRMCKWGQSDTHLRPLCKIHEETCDHALQCPHQEIKFKRMM